MAKIYQRGKQTLNRRTDNTMAKRYQRGKQTLNRRTDNTMAKRYQRGKQTLNQRTDNTMAKRKKDKQCKTTFSCLLLFMIHDTPNFLYKG
jgi:hypothetical protein